MQPRDFAIAKPGDRLLDYLRGPHAAVLLFEHAGANRAAMPLQPLVHRGDRVGRNGVHDYNLRGSDLRGIGCGRCLLGGVFEEIVKRFDQHLGVAHFRQRPGCVAKAGVLFAIPLLAESASRTRRTTARKRLNRLRAP